MSPSRTSKRQSGVATVETGPSWRLAEVLCTPPTLHLPQPRGPESPHVAEPKGVPAATTASCLESSGQAPALSGRYAACLQESVGSLRGPCEDPTESMSEHPLCEHLYMLL